jgi:hypothetical protein
MSGMVRGEKPRQGSSQVSRSKHLDMNDPEWRRFSRRQLRESGDIRVASVE